MHPLEAGFEQTPWPGKARPTLRDVARAAGFSYMTVLRAFNTPELVKDETREKITRAANGLGYIPNLLASQLTRSRSWSVAMIVPALSNSFWASIVEGSNEVLAANGHLLFFGLVAEHPGRRASEEELLKSLLGRCPEGLILVPFGHTAMTRLHISNAQVPVVEVPNLPIRPIDSAVGFSVGDAFFQLGEALQERGYRRFGFLHRDFGDDELAAPRLEGLRRALASRGLDLPESAVQDCAHPTVTSARTGFETLINREPTLDVVVCATDYLAYGAILHCQRQGVAVPEDIAVAGFGNMELSTELSPTLTTISVDGREIGRRAAQHLVARMENGTPGGQIDDVGFRLVFRESA